jgi:hypothetical protein
MHVRHLNAAARRLRSASGQMMGVADLMIVIPATILCFFFLTNTGLSLYYKGKLGAVADEAARYAAQRISSPDVEQDTKQFLIELFHKMGLPASDIRTKVERIMVRDAPAVKVSITAEFDLLQGSPLPYKIGLSETGVTTNLEVGQCVVRVLMNGSVHSAYLPMVRSCPALPTFYNPRLMLSDQGASIYATGAPDLQ